MTIILNVGKFRIEIHHEPFAVYDVETKYDTQNFRLIKKVKGGIHTHRFKSLEDLIYYIELFEPEFFK